MSATEITPGASAAIVARGAASAFIIRFAGVVLSYGLAILLAKQMGVDHYGVYAYALGWVLVLAIPGRLGFDFVLLRQLAAYSIRGEWGLMRGIIRRSTQLGLGVAGALALLAAVVVLALGPRLAADLRHTLLIGFATVPLLVIILLWQHAVQSQRRILQAYMSGEVARPVAVGLLVLAVIAWTDRPLTGPAAMTLELLGTCAVLPLAYALLTLALPRERLREPPHYQTRKWVAMSWPMMVISSLSALLSRTDLLLVGLMLGTTEAGLYFAALKTSELIPFGLVSANAIIAPMISALHTQRRHDELQQMVLASSRWVVLLTLPAALGCILFSGSILGLFGAEFVGARRVLAILAVGQFMNAAAGPVGLLLTMTGRERACARVLAWSSAINVLAVALGIAAFGMIGAAAGTAFGLILRNVWLLILVRRQLNIRSTVLLASTAGPGSAAATGEATVAPAGNAAGAAADRSARTGPRRTPPASGEIAAGAPRRQGHLHRRSRAVEPSAGLRWPDFLIVGAAKSGTTSLFEYIGQHPQAHVPVCKEPCYFSDGHPVMAHSDAEYARLFAGCSPQKVTGEASTSYLYDPPAAERIHRLLPQVKILIMLRNPIARAYSAWGHNYYQVSYERLSFPEAVQAEDERVHSETFRRECPFFYGGYHYVRAGLYYDQVRRFIDLFGRDRVQVHIFEEFARDPQAACRRVFEYLGIDPEFRPRVHAYNSAPGFRYKWLHRCLVYPPRRLEQLYQRLPMPVRIQAYRAGRALYALNLKHHPRPPLDEQLRARLAERFEDDIRRLEALLGRDLSLWTRSRA